ncbi:hypothetical protein INR49_017664, partial [Caranx melampygus]
VPPRRRRRRRRAVCCRNRRKAPRISSVLHRTGLNHHTHPLRSVCREEVEEVVEVEEETGRFLCYCLVLKGRSQLLILRCKEKAPCRECTGSLGEEEA